MNDPLRSTVACNLCGHDHVSVVGTRSRSGRPLRSVACHRCGLVWSDPRPHDTRRYYAEDYRLEYKGTWHPRPKHVARAGVVALSRFRRIAHLLAGSRRVLDVGSGGGEFAYLLATRGHQVRGIEPNRGYAEFAGHEYGLDIVRGFIDEVALDDGAWDVITVWHVLEHTESPSAVLARLAAALRPGGALVIEVPNIEATCQSPRSTFHEAHLFGFNLATLAAMAARAGLTVREQGVSEDGGNITMVFGRTGLPAPASDTALAGNHDRVAGILRAHTPARHVLTAHPWRRAASRFARWLSESRETRTGITGRALLDRMYRTAPAAGPAGAAGGDRWHRLWKPVAVAYVLAVALEWVLLDGVLPSSALTELQGLGIYLGAQCGVVIALATALRRGERKLIDWLKLGGWSVPLFALPIYC